MSKIKAVIKPVVEELGKFGEAAKNQVTSQKDTNDDQKSKVETQQLVKDIYKPTENKSPDELAKKKEEDEAAKKRLRQELHSNYYETLTNPSKPKEERPAEAIERKKMEDLQEKEKKKTPVLVQRARERVEKYPGASG